MAIGRWMAGGDCPSQLSDERTELLELQWRDGCPVEQPVLDGDRDSGDDAGAGDASSPEEKKDKAAGGGEAIEERWKLWREGESGGCAAPAAHGYPQAIDDLSSVNAKVATAASVGLRHQTRTAGDETADELWREGHGSTAPQVSSSKNSALKDEDSLLPSSEASRGSGAAQRHSSEQINQQCCTLDHAIEYMKSLQQQIQVLSRHPAAGRHAASGVSVRLRPAASPSCCNSSPPPPPSPPPAAAAPLYQPVPPPRPAAAAADLNPDITVAAGGAPGGVPGLIGIGTGLGEEMAWSTSEMPFGGCARCSFRRRAGDC